MGKPKLYAEKKRDDVVGRFVLEVMPNGRFRWHFENVNALALLGMLDVAAHELREKIGAGEFK
jgi:hypothetical protein